MTINASVSLIHIQTVVQDYVSDVCLTSLHCLRASRFSVYILRQVHDACQNPACARLQLHVVLYYTLKGSPVRFHSVHADDGILTAFYRIVMCFFCFEIIQ